MAIQKLFDNGYIKQGTHPVIWCPHDQSPTGDHDRLIGEGESPQEYNIILFEVDNKYLACATLRPETVFEATNIWVKDAEYVIAKTDNKEWIISENAIAKLKDQLHNVEIIRKISSKELIKLKATHPISKKKIPIFESDFVDIEHATGIVMSVPSHAPYDYIALSDLIKEGNNDAKKALSHAKNMIHVSGVPTDVLNAAHYAAKNHAHTLQDKDALEKATSELYKIEFHKGKFTIKELEGLNAEDAKKKTLEILKEKMQYHQFMK
jgi:leucyl-tRNA synthetase